MLNTFVETIRIAPKNTIDEKLKIWTNLCRIPILDTFDEREVFTVLEQHAELIMRYSLQAILMWKFWIEWKNYLPRSIINSYLKGKTKYWDQEYSQLVKQDLEVRQRLLWDTSQKKAELIKDKADQDRPWSSKIWSSLSYFWGWHERYFVF